MPEEKLHPHFRLWVLLPFEAIESDLSTECPKVAFNHIDEEGPKVSEHIFMDINVCNFRKIIRSNQKNSCVLC